MGREYSLEQVRADGWFERLGDGAPHFVELCEVLGERTVAFSVVAGVRITSVAVDRRYVDGSVVTFTLGDGTDEHELPLGDLRRRLCASLATSESLPEGLPDGDTPEALQRFIGFRYLLLAPLFGVRLETLHVAEGEAPRITIAVGPAQETIGLQELRDIVHERVRGEGQSQASPFAIDLNIVPRAVSANERGDHQKVVEILGAWPGPLSMLLRTAEGQQLSNDVKGTLSRALGMLGAAYVELGSFEWAEEVLRLGIQWSQELDPVFGAELFRVLGEAHARRGRHGQAIGLLRRALQLGAPASTVLPALAESLAAREKRLAAIVVATRALGEGLEDSAAKKVRALLGQQQEALGEAWTRYAELTPEGRA